MGIKDTENMFYMTMLNGNSSKGDSFGQGRWLIIPS